MTVPFAMPRIELGRPCNHLPAKLTNPWWSYACQRCCPNVYAVFTEPGYGPDETVECPWCLEPARRRGGVLRRHWEDSGVDCRASGLSTELAKRLFDAIIAGSTVEEFVYAQMKRRKLVAAVNVDPGVPILRRLIDLRHAAGKPQSWLASAIGVGKPAVTDWETGRQSPSTENLLKWASALGQYVVIVNESTREREMVPTAKAACWILERARRNAKLSIAKLSAEVGVSAHAMQRWEGGRTEPKLTALIDWATGLGLELKLEGKE